jgi:hypothetical protein
VRRALTLSAAAAVTAVGVLAPAAPAAAEGLLAPGQTRVMSVALAPGDWNGAVPAAVTVQVTRLVQLENECLEPESDAGDETCLPQQGELAGQLQATAAAGVFDDRNGACEARGPRAGLGLLSPDRVELTLFDGQGWDDVDCLHLELTFRDLTDNNLAQSDTVDFDLRAVAWGLPPASTDAETSPIDSSAPGSGTSDGTGASSAGPVGAGPVVGAGAPAAGQPAAGVPSAGGTTPLAPTSGDAGGAAGGEVLGQVDASVSIDGDGASVETQSAESSLLGTALAWGGAFLGVLALGWFLFLVVRRRRRTERAA